MPLNIQCKCHSLRIVEDEMPPRRGSLSGWRERDWGGLFQGKAVDAATGVIFAGMGGMFGSATYLTAKQGDGLI